MVLRLEHADADDSTDTTRALEYSVGGVSPVGVGAVVMGVAQSPSPSPSSPPSSAPGVAPSSAAVVMVEEEGWEGSGVQFTDITVSEHAATHDGLREVTP
jgi:Rieske Fe-S protein